MRPIYIPFPTSILDLPSPALPSPIDSGGYEVSYVTKDQQTRSVVIAFSYLDTAYFWVCIISMASCLFPAMKEYHSSWTNAPSLM